MSELKNRGYRVIDAHAHIFPEKIAAKAASAIGDFMIFPCTTRSAQ